MHQIYAQIALGALLVLTVSAGPINVIDAFANSNVNSNLTFPSNCQEAMNQNQNISGVYWIKLPNFPDIFRVHCIPDPLKGAAAWTLIQRRQDGHESFFRSWIDYDNGFGNLNKEFFIGLRKLHALTNNQPQELWIELQDYLGNRLVAKYDAFAVGDTRSKYRLNTLGTYSGNATDALYYHRNQKFSTFDADNDSSSSNCAEVNKGGWWFNMYIQHCMYSDLNGLYYGYGLKSSSPISDVFWSYNGIQSNSKSFNYVHMAIRSKAQK